MTPTRRLFIQNAAFSVIAATLFPAAFAQKPPKSQGQTFNPDDLTALDGVSMQTFEAWIGSSFRVSLNNKTLSQLVLLSVEEMNTGAKEESSAGQAVIRRTSPVSQAPPGPAVTSFALRFQGSGAALKQNTYLLSHNWLGNFPLLLVPSGLSGSRPTCTAVFSMLDQRGPKRLE
jgi:hypothetical protein